MVFRYYKHKGIENEVSYNKRIIDLKYKKVHKIYKYTI